MNAALATARVGGLVPVRVVRHIEPFYPPVGFPLAVLDAIRAGLATLGCQIRSSAPDVIEFDGPGIWTPNLQAALVTTGTVTFETGTSGQVARLELGLNPWLTYGWALVVALGAVAVPSMGLRILGLLFLAMFTLINFVSCVDAYMALAGEAVRRGTLAAGAAVAVSPAAARPALTDSKEPGGTTARDTAATEEEIEARLAELSELGAWEWQLHAFDGDRLTLAGGQDMDCGRHFAEAHFSGVTYVSCPTRMMHPRFRLGTRHEATLARLQAEVPPGSFVIAIDSDTTSAFDAVSLIVASSVEWKRS